MKQVFSTPHGQVWYYKKLYQPKIKINVQSFGIEIYII